MAEKVSTMVLKVDLQCSCCYKKIKKILCKYPEIRDQVFDEKANTVTVTVVCCCPEKIRDKLCFKGGKVIKSIEIKEPEKPKVVVVEKPKDPPKPKAVVIVEPEKPKADGGKAQDKPKEAPKSDSGKPKEAPKSDAGKPEGKPKEAPKSDAGKPEDKPKEAPKAKGPDPAAKPPPAPAAANPVSGIPPVMAYYGPSYDGFGGGAPWYNGYGVPPPPLPLPPPQPRYDVYEYGYPYSRCDNYFSEENPSACSIM